MRGLVPGRLVDESAASENGLPENRIQGWAFLERDGFIGELFGSAAQTQFAE